MAAPTSTGLSRLGQVAVEYADRGFHVLPIVARQKAPILIEGGEQCRNASRDLGTVGSWWASHPDANIAIATGPENGRLLIIDLDNHGGADGVGEAKRWQAEHERFPETICAITPTDGMHLYYRVPEGGDVSQFATGVVDVRWGGYALAEPSVHPDIDPDEATYQWSCAPWDMDPDDYDQPGAHDFTLEDVPPVDDNVVAFIEHWHRVSVAAHGGTTADGWSPFELPDEIPEGMRDDTIFKLACSCRARGADGMDRAETTALCLQVNAERCKPPMSKRDILKKVEQAWKYPAGQSAEFKAMVAEKDSDAALVATDTTPDEKDQQPIPPDAGLEESMRVIANSLVKLTAPKKSGKPKRDKPTPTGYNKGPYEGIPANSREVYLADAMTSDPVIKGWLRRDALATEPVAVAMPGGPFTTSKLPAPIMKDGPVEATILKHIQQNGWTGSAAKMRVALRMVAGGLDPIDPWADFLRGAVPLIKDCEEEEFNDRWLMESWDGGETWTMGPRWYGRVFNNYLMDPLVPSPHAQANCEIEALAERAIVARAEFPGCEYQYMPVLVGPQGCGKSTVVKVMGLASRFHLGSVPEDWGTETVRAIQGKAVAEIAELQGFSKSKQGAIKRFISLDVDSFRGLYQGPVDVNRRCVFFGTTNDREFLKDPSGNRRYPVVECTRKTRTPEPRVKGWTREKPAGCPCSTELQHDVLVAYAEAYALLESMGKDAFLAYLELPDSVAEEVDEVQREHQTTGPVYDVIMAMLDEITDWPESDHVHRRICAATVETRLSSTRGLAGITPGMIRGELTRFETDGFLARCVGEKPNSRFKVCDYRTPQKVAWEWTGKSLGDVA